MTTYTHTLDLEAFYNGDFKTDKEIIILDYSNKYLHRPIQLCILNPKCASVIANSKSLANTIVEKWMPDRSDKYPYVISCMIDNWLIEKDMHEKNISLITDVTITSVDICKHLRGETPVVENYYVFTRDPGRFGDYKINGFNTNDDYNNSVIDIAKEFLNKDLKRIEVSNTVAVI